MRLRNFFAVLLSVLLIPLFPLTAHSSQKVLPGHSCKIYKQKVVNQNKTYTCVKSGKRLIWNKGVVIQKPKPAVVNPPVETSPFQTSTKSSGIEACKLKFKNKWETGFGFPRSSNRLPNVGVIKSIFIFVDFPDAPGTDRPSEVAKRYFDQFNEYYKTVSYEKVSFSYTVPDRYFRIDKPSSSYRMNMKKGEQNPDPAAYFQDALKVADPTVDFSGFDVVYIIPSNTIAEITYGPAFPMGIGNDILKTDEKIFYSGAVAGTDSRLQENSLEWVWLAHETGHLFGLEHPWKVQSTAQGATTTGSEVAIWDLMLAMWKHAPKANEFLGWTRFLLSWIDDSQVNCQDSLSLATGELKFKLSPLSSNTPDEKIAVIRLTDTKAIVIEVRRSLGFDKIPSEYEGTLIYLVDVTKQSNEGMATLISSNTSLINGLSVGTMKAGSSVEFEDLTLQVLYSDSSGDYIRVFKR